MTLTARNVLVIIADDLGKERVFGARAFSPPTPNITALKNAGVRFERMWTMPACSHTRGAALSMRYALRTGLTGVIDTDEEAAMPLNELLVPALLDLASPGQIDSACIGKFHLGNPENGDWQAPLRFGFKKHVGTKGNLRQDGGVSYTDWRRAINGRIAQETAYATTKQTDDALEWINGHSVSQNWLCWLGYSAPHAPHDRPPAPLYTVDAYAAYNPGVPYPLPNPSPIAGEDQIPYQLAMVQALDTEIGRLLANITPALLANTTVIFWSDNGTTGGVVIEEGFDRVAHAKGTVYEQAVCNVLTVSGAGVSVVGTTLELVSCADIGRTILDIYGVDPELYVPKGRTIDGVSFKPILTNLAASSGRTYLFTEQFDQHGKYLDPTTATGLVQRAIRDAQFKLIRKHLNGAALPEEFYDVIEDPGEQINLLNASPTLSAPAAASRATLTATLDALLASR